jgi:hypothetical protein
MPRADLFTSIHKAIRALVCHTVGVLQRADFADAGEARGAAAELEKALLLLRDHHDTEERYIFPEVRPFEPQIVDALEADHREIERLLGVAEEALAAAGAAGDASRADAGVALNRRFNELAAFYLEHLAREETTILPATWEHFTDEALGAIQAAIMQGLPPDEVVAWLTWMVRALNRAELVGMLGGAKATMPPPAFAHVKAVAEANMDAGLWRAVSEQAGL